MLAAPPAVPDGVIEAAQRTAGLDRIMGDGFARLTPAQVSELEAFALTFGRSPLGEVLGQAVAALGQGELLAHHLAVVAAARASLEGSRADALLHAAAEAAGLVVEQPECTTPEPPAEAGGRMESARQWLTEVALTGLHQLDRGAIVPVVATLEGIQAAPSLRALAALLTGFAHELLEHAPTASVPEPPLRRWSDLWAKAMLLTYALPEVPTSRTVSGRLVPLGVDLRHHDHLASAVVHGLFEEDSGDRRLVHVTLSAWKVDAVSGPEIWRLLHPLAPALFDALHHGVAVDVTDATLAAGALRIDGTYKTGTQADPFAVDLQGAVLTAPLPRDRHPIQVAVPVVWRGLKIGKDAMVAGLPLAMERLSPHVGATPAAVTASTELVALLRFDGGAWQLQPLVGRGGKKAFGPSQGLAAAAKLKSAALDVLRERAGKLLRA